MDPPPPPAYQTDTRPNETALAPTASVQINSSNNISGIRDQILDNTLTLYSLAHGEKGRKNMPHGFRVITWRVPATIRDHPAGMTRASIIQDYSNSSAILPFVQGPPAEGTEAALLALLDKVETMIGSRWKRLTYLPNYLAD